ncbi:hypothetical protein ACN6LM_003776 [Streptomyces sp. SAS_281]|uniref:hypothetical protein n=1 Tax=Streptomyces sp. SAS_281 TaxID=3412744 RepID=UPI00403D3FB5
MGPSRPRCPRRTARCLVDRHRELVRAQTSVTFYLKLLNRLSSGEFPVDTAWFERVDRAVDQMEEAAEERDAAARKVLAALESIGAAAASVCGEGTLSTDDGRHYVPSLAEPGSTSICGPVRRP